MLRWSVLGLALLCMPLAWAGGSSTDPSHLMIHKVSPVLLAQWKNAAPRARRRQWAECFVRLDGAATPDRLQSLEAVGVVVRSVIPARRDRQRPSTLLTARVRLEDLPSVAGLAFVESIEGAARVGLKPVTR